MAESPSQPELDATVWLALADGARLVRGPAGATLVLATREGERRIDDRGGGEYRVAPDVVAAGWDSAWIEPPTGSHTPLPPLPHAEVVASTVLAERRARRYAAVAPPGPAEAPSAEAVAPPQPEPALPASPGTPTAPAAEPITPPPAPDPPAGPSSGAPAWTAPPRVRVDPATVDSRWRERRSELERDLARAAEALSAVRDSERVEREAVLAALAAAEADLRAARAARDAEASSVVVLAGELDAERVAHAVTRARVATLVRELGLARAATGESESLLARVARLDRDASGPRDQVEHERRAREQAEAAATAGRRAPEQTGRLVADLDAAAAALRRAAGESRLVAATAAAVESRPDGDQDSTLAPPEFGTVESRPHSDQDSTPTSTDDASVESPPGDDSAPDGLAGEPAAGLVAATGAADEPPAALPAAAAHPSPPARYAPATATLVRRPWHLRLGLVSLARDDPAAAAQLLAALLPAQGAVIGGPISYDVTIRELGTFAVTIADGTTEARPIDMPRGRRHAKFLLDADALTLSQLLSGEHRRLRRLGPKPRLKGRRRRARVLYTLPTAPLSLTEALTAGATLEPSVVYRALPYAIDPAWTRGFTFTVAQEIVDRTWFVTARDGDRVHVSEERPTSPPHATVSMTEAAFAHLLRGEPSDHGARPIVRGDLAAVAALKAWTDMARGD